MASKQKVLSGRIAFSRNPAESQVYWKCPSRGCTQVHYFNYVLATSGIAPVYTKHCSECEKEYLATQLHTTGTVATLAIKFEDTEDD